MLCTVSYPTSRSGSRSSGDKLQITLVAFWQIEEALEREFNIKTRSLLMQAYSLSRLQRSLCNSTLLRMYHHERMLLFWYSNCVARSMTEPEFETCFCYQYRISRNLWHLTHLSCRLFWPFSGDPHRHHPCCFHCRQG